MALASNGAQCKSERVDCGSRMLRLYGLDFWRADLLSTMDFSKLMDAAHSVDEFTKFCKYVISLAYFLI